MKVERGCTTCNRNPKVDFVICHLCSPSKWFWWKPNELAEELIKANTRIKELEKANEKIILY